MNTRSIPRRGTVLFGVSALALALLSALLRCVNLKFFFDAEIGYYPSGAVLPIVANALLVASVLLFAVAAILLLRKRTPATVALPPRSLQVASGIAAVGFLLLAAVNIVGGSVWSGILSLGTALFFAVDLSRKSAPPLLRVLTALSAVLRLLFILGGSYFDVTVQMNAPDKLLLHLACLGGMLLIVSHVRAATGKPRPVLFAFSFACGTLFLGVAAIPYLLDCFLGVLGAWGEFDLLFEMLALLSLGIYAAIRLLTMDRIYAPSEEEPAAEAEVTAEGSEPVSEEPQASSEDEESVLTEPDDPVDEPIDEVVDQAEPSADDGPAPEEET